MNIDTELDMWRRQWILDTPLPHDLRTKVERQSRVMKIALTAEILVTVTMGGGTTAWALRSPQPDIVLLAIVTWLFLAAAWTMSLAINRRTWSPSALNTAAFLDLSVRRCRGRLKATWFGAGLYIVEMAFCLPWVYNHSSRHTESFVMWLSFTSFYIDMVWLATLVFCVLLFWYRRRKRSELAYLLNLREQLVPSPTL